MESNIGHEKVVSEIGVEQCKLLFNLFSNKIDHFLKLAHLVFHSFIH